ncbi:uncharacterized protein LOC113454394, partial [Pseudonaja textilis]|uniref:uncharacterized protein LOC113454394 n=1 Tax=Pseudonaja textilis TaxID=8673 RepID=UPI000EA9891C
MRQTNAPERPPTNEATPAAAKPRDTSQRETTAHHGDLKSQPDTEDEEIHRLQTERDRRDHRSFGIGHFKVTFKNHTDVLPLTIVDRDRPSLLGLQWFAPLGIEVTSIHRTDTADWEATLVRDFQEVFDNSLGKYRGPPISFNLNPNVAPIRLKPRRVPFALKPKIDEQLDKLVAQGVLEPIDHARRVFAKLDLAQAYQQLPVDAETAEAQTIVTHRGAFRCNRLQFGFLGYLLDRHGIHPTGKKLRAIKEAPTPTNKAELQAFLGLLNFYNVFLPQKATVAEPLHRLLDKAATWTWGKREETAFQRTKDLLTSDAVLIQYSETLPLSVTCDASPFGIGAVLSHTLPDGTEAPIAFFSRTLAKPERNYSQLDKEALAIVAGVKRFHEYLYGRNFSIITDHKPLLGILAGNKATPNILSPRMTRWSEFLAAYSYELSHRPGKAILHADALSRAPLPDGCILWGDRVVIPETLRDRVLALLHEGHPGVVKMKALARSYAWWPGTDKQIETWVAVCSKCQESRANPPAAPIREWETPRGPWSRLHIDFAGPTKGYTFLITVDAYSNWLEVSTMRTTTTEAVIDKLNRLFATHGLPDVIVSDNGPQFTAILFEKYLAERGIRHALTSTAHPAANGRAERMVQYTKKAIQKIETGDIQEKINRLLFIQHITPSTTTNKSPAELLMGRKLRSPLDCLHPTYNPEKPPDSSSRYRTFNIGDAVYAKNFTGDPLWVPAQITQVTGPRSYRLQTTDGRSWKRHIDQLRSRLATNTPIDPATTAAQESREGGEASTTNPETNKRPEPTRTHTPAQAEHHPPDDSNDQANQPDSPTDLDASQTGSSPG